MEHHDTAAGWGSLDENLTKSENISANTQEDATQLLDSRKSPSLRNLKSSLRSRLSFGRNQSTKKRSDTSYENTLTIPLLGPEQERRSREDRSKVRVHTGTSEEHYVKSRERGRGSFVVVKIKSPGPEDFLDNPYVRKLEENFRLNHMFGSLTVDVGDGMRNIIRQGQVRESRMSEW